MNESNLLNQQVQGNTMTMGAASDVTMANTTPTHIPASQQNPYADARNQTGAGINKKLIALVSGIAAVLIIGAIVAVLLVVLSSNDNDTPTMLNQPSPSTETVATPTPAVEQKTDPSPETTTPELPPETTPEPEPINYNPIQYFEMSDDIFDFTVMLDGDVFELPLRLEVFLSYGWEPEDDISGTFVSGQYESFGFSRNGKRAYVTLANMSDEPRYILDSTVCGFWNITESYDAVIALPKGIQTRVSSFDDVISSFGEPTNLYDSRDSDYDWEAEYATFTYRYVENGRENVYRSIEIRTTDGVVREIYIRNLTQIPSDLISNSAEISTEITERERDYRAPSELGNNLLSFVVEIDGDLYTLPAPVSAFLNNGWEIPEGATSMLPERTKSSGLRLEKGNSILNITYVANYSDRLMYVENCFAEGVATRRYGSDEAIITLPGGITIGTPEETVLDLFGNTLEKKYYSDYESWYYEFEVDISSSLAFHRDVRKIRLEIDKDTMLVNEIEVQNVE